jgi:hypothetical protein
MVMASLARTASLAGLVALAAILIVELLVPSVVTGGPPISGTLDRATIVAYYGHPGLELALGLGLFAVALPAFLVFAVATREVSAGRGVARTWASLGAGFALAAVPVYVVKGAISAALVSIVGSGLDPVPLFRVYDLVYNGAIYPLEAAYVLGLGMAIAAMAAGSGWLRRLTIAASGILLLNTLVVYLGLPSAAALPGNVAFAIWLGGASVALWRLEPSIIPERAPAPA